MRNTLKFNILFLFFFLYIPFQVFSACSTTTAPTYSNTCTAQYYTSITASGTGVTSTIAVTGVSCTGITYFNYYATQGISAPAGGTVNVSLSRAAVTYTGYQTIYIDWNNNGIYETTELAGAMTVYAGLSMTYSFTIPTTGVVTGTNLHMRAMLSELATGAPCTANWGQTCDFYININCSIPPVITCTPASGSICNGGSLALTASGAGTGGTYSWSPSGSLSAATGTTVMASPTTTTTYTVTGTNSIGCPGTTTATITVNPLPVATISPAGPLSICPGGSVVLTATAGAGYTYQWYNGVTLIAGATNINYTATGAGNFNVLITNSYGCSSTSSSVVVTISALPTAVITPAGPTSFCPGGSVVLNATTGAGYTYQWYNTGVLIAGATSSSYTATLAGNYTVVVTSSLGCNATSTAVTITIYPVPAATISATGSLSFCPGGSVVLNANAGAGYTYQWYNGGTLIAGATNINYTASTTGNYTVVVTNSFGCSATSAVTAVSVYPLPAAISGPSTVCLGSTVTLTDATTGCAWSSSNSSIASIISGTGVVTGAGIGTATITYTNTTTNCYVTYSETVNSLPSAIAGPNTVCVGSTVNMTNTTTGGTWSSSFLTIATVIPSTGIVAGMAAGTDTIVYFLGTGCRATKLITVNPLPAAITGPSQLCTDSVITLLESTSGGTWSSSNIAKATIGATSGTVIAISTTLDTVLMSYSLSLTGCAVSAIVTINPLPDPISGVSTLCIGGCTTLLEATSGGTWTNSSTAFGTIGSGSGIICGSAVGSTMVTYTVTSTGCQRLLPVTINSYPGSITGVSLICAGSVTTLSNSTSGGIWISSNPSIATVDSFSGIVTGVSNSTVTISYGNGCNATKIITVNPHPAPITGLNYICASGSTTTLSESVTGGTWSSSNNLIATVNSLGIVSSVSVGSVCITYTIFAGCSITDSVSITPLPAPLSGPDSLCIGSSVTLLDVVTGGHYTSSYSPVATVDYYSGLVSAVSSGSVVITYTAGTGCFVSKILYVKPLETVAVTVSATPSDTICLGETVIYSAYPVNGGTSPHYQWTVGSTVVSGATSNTFLYSPLNGNLIKCQVTSNADCPVGNPALSNSILMTVIDTTHPTLQISSTLGDTICTGSINNYSVNATMGGNSPVFEWSVNWLPVGSGATNYSYNPYNGDIVTCKMVSSSRCARPDTVRAVDTVVVKDYHQPVLSLTSSGGISTCAGNLVTLTASPTWGGWGPSYIWSVNGVVMTATGNQYSYLPADGDTVKCVMLSNYYCDTPIYSNKAERTISMEVDPVIVVVVSGHPGQLVTEGRYDTLFASVSNGGVSPHYQWKVNGIPLIGENSDYLIRNDFVNDDSVNCEVTTGSGTACEGVIGFHWMKLVVGHTGFTTLTNSLENLELLPNPNKGTFILQGIITSTDELTYEITNVLGQIVYVETNRVNPGKLFKEISMDEKMPNGIYILHISGLDLHQVMSFTVSK